MLVRFFPPCPSVQQTHSEIEALINFVRNHRKRSGLNEVGEVGSQDYVANGNKFSSAAYISDQGASVVFRKTSSAAHCMLMHPSRSHQCKNIDVQSVFQSCHHLQVSYGGCARALHTIERRRFADL